MPSAEARFASGSVSIARTRSPFCASTKASQAVTLDLPTPPFPDMAIFIELLPACTDGLVYLRIPADWCASLFWGNLAVIGCG